jgi:membrane fusion protein, multidrug efflux system
MMSGCGAPRKPNGASRGFGWGAAAVVLTSMLATGCHQTATPKINKVVEVVVTTPVTDEVTDYEDFTGRLDALKTVDIRPRVSGYITEAPFVEGDIVKKDDVLFQIDPAPYDADLEQARANLKQAQAEEVLQTRRAERGKRLFGTAAIGPEDYDQLIAARDKAIATVGAMKAALDHAELNRKWTTVKVPPLTDDAGRPLSGRISRRLVDPGNLVNADQTILTTLVSIDPVYAYFDVDERTYLKLASLADQGSSSWFSALQFPVLMRLANEDEFHRKGGVNFLDNRLNANTGTVRMRGVFANPSGVLKSGLFVRIRLPIGVPYKTVMIPDEALLSDQGRKYVYVVKKSKNEQGDDVEQVEYRAVELGQSIQGLRVIKDGKLKEGERVIISGMQRVRPGSVVKATLQDPPAPPKSALTQILKENAAMNPPAQPLSSAGNGAKGEGAVAAPSLKDMPRLESGHAHHEGKGRH